MRRILFILLMVSIKSFAQLEIGSFTTSGQKITENAIEGSALIIKQSYQVKNKKNGKVFGRNGREDFGHIYSVGVKTEAGFVLTDLALKPWLYDDAFKKVEQEYDPVISLTEVRDVKVTDKKPFKQCPLQIGKQQIEGLWIANSADAGKNEMEIDAEGGAKDGWLIWLIAKNDLEKEESAIINVQVSNQKIEIKADTADIDIEAPSSSNLIIGGIYVCPSFLGGGHVAYKLVGITIKDENNWKLRTPFVGSHLCKSTKGQEEIKEPQPNELVQEAEDNDEDLGLTPIIENKKKKKNKKSKK